MPKKFYVTTPIYYANGLPHIGHAYSSFIADAFARAKRLLGYQVKFSTGLDENGQKMVQKAESEGKDVMTFLDEIADGSLKIWENLDISYTDFIRTTEARHHEFVQKTLNKIYDKQDGDIYRGEYVGLYCVGCEAFKNPRDLVNGVCPDHLTKPDEIKEKNWFFKLSKYQSFLENHFAQYPQFVQPQWRFNEVKSFVWAGVEDFSISREGNNFGIPLPFDNSQVTYVWFDALLNYITVCQNQEVNFWDDDTQIVHILGKDIVKFHATYWPAMLESAGYRFPDQEFVTGYLTVDGQKMSKSLWNIVDPVQLVHEYDRDAVVFYLLYDAPIGVDGDFSWERFAGTYESALIGAWGNLVNRVTSLCSKYEITEAKLWNYEDFLAGLTPELLDQKYLQSWDFQWYLQEWYALVQSANWFITRAEPRKKYKDEATKQEALDALAFLLYIVKNLALLSAPILVNGFAKIQNILGNETLSAIDSSKDYAVWSTAFAETFAMKEFTVNLKPEIIYQRKEKAE